MIRQIGYKKIDIAIKTTPEPLLDKKASALSLNSIINTINLLNVSINSLGRNPSHILLLFNVLMKLP